MRVPNPLGAAAVSFGMVVRAFLSLNFSAAAFLQERARQARFQSPLRIKKSTTAGGLPSLFDPSILICGGNLNGLPGSRRLRLQMPLNQLAQTLAVFVFHINEFDTPTVRP